MSNYYGFRFIVVLTLAFAIAARARGDVVVDNDAGAPGYVETGSWTLSASTGYNGGTYRTTSSSPPQPLSTATWTPLLLQSRMYDVYAAFRSSDNRTTSAPMTVVHADGTTTVYLNQYGANAVVEVLLGRFRFDAAGGGYVRMDNTGAPNAYIADAMIWRIPVDHAPVISSMMREPEDVAAGQAAATVATITDDNGVASVELHYSVSPSGLSGTITALDDGVHGDLAAGDSIYGATIPAQPRLSIVTYCYEATDDAGQVTTSPLQFYEVEQAQANSHDIVVQNDDGTPQYVETGTWVLSSSVGYKNSTYRYATSTNGASPTSTATWTPDIPEAGAYRLYAAFALGTNRSTSVPLIITHAQGTSTVYLNQYGGSGVVEMFIGEYQFNAGTGGSVRMDNNCAPGVCIADAFVWRQPGPALPLIQGVTRWPSHPMPSDDVHVTATITHEIAITSAALSFQAGSGGLQTVAALDDGAHGDGAAGDHVYGASIPAQTSGTAVRLFYSATDPLGNTVTSPEQRYVVGQRAGTVYVVMSSDTSVWGFSGGNHPIIPWGVFTSRRGVLARLYEDAFRQQLTDSYGTPFKLTWFMHGGAWFTAAVNSLPISPVHHIRANWGEGIRRFDDALEYHFHHYVWDGDWLQAPTFEETIWEYEWVMSEMMLEEKLFIAAFRSGWNYMDNPYQQYLERWVPFRMEGVQKNWLPYHPDFSDWKQPGAMKGWETRHIYTNSVTQSIANGAFAAAQTGADQVMCIWSHQNETDFPEQLQRVDALLHNAAAAYPAVPFRYCTAREGMRAWKHQEDAMVAPPLSASTQIDGDMVAVHLETSDDIYQEQPWVAARDKTGRCWRLDAAKTGPGKWAFSYSRQQFDRVGAGVTDVNGNDVMVEIPDGSQCWTAQSDFASAHPVDVDYDTSPTGVMLAKSFGAFKLQGSLRFDYLMPQAGFWKSIEVAGDTPEGTSLQMRHRTAPSESELADAAWSAYASANTIDLPAGSAARWISVEVMLSGTLATSPRLDSLEVRYDAAPAGISSREMMLY